MDNLSFGGAERVAANLANALPKDVYDVEFHMRHDIYDFPIDPGIPTRLIRPLTAEPDGWILALERFWSKFPPDVVVSHLGRTNISGLAARCLSGQRFPIVCVEHTVVSAYFESSPKMLLNDGERERLRFGYREFYPHADVVVAPRPEIAEDLAVVTGLDPDRMTVIHNPAVPDDILKLAREPTPHPWYDDASKTVIIGVGRLSAEKGFDLLVDAFTLARRARPDLRLLILGGGPEHDLLLARIRANELEQDALLLGPEPNPYAHMARAAMLVIPSKFEGIPVVLGEAMACGTPVVCVPHTGGTQAALRDKAAGRVADRRTPEALSDAILAELTGRSAERPAGQIPEDFSVANATRLYDRAIRRVLAAGPSSISLGDKDAVRRMASM